MPTGQQIDAWEIAWAKLRLAYYHLKEQLGKTGEALAIQDYQKARLAYESAATDLG